MPEETWHQARLIPTSGINGADEQEGRATSALLSVMSAVKEFSRTLLGPLGAPAGLPETYIEVPFPLGEKNFRPDGLIRVTRAGKPWTALVEVKTGRNLLTTEQVEAYLDIAREQGFNAVITISNEIPAIAGQHPTKLDKRKLKKVEVHHWSWSYILATAVMQKEVRGVSDPEQAWILGELIRYLEHPRSGALEFEDMGPNWVSVRNAVEASTLRTTDKTITDVTARFDALLRFASLRLGRQLGTEVLPVLSRKEAADPNLRTQALVSQLVGSGELGGVIRIPNTVSPIYLTANLRSGKVTAHVDIDAPRDGRATTRVGWLVRQLKNAPADTRVEAFVANARGAGAAELLGTIRENPSAIILDPKKDLRTFRVARTVAMGAKAGRGRGTFIDSVLDLLDAFYADVVQHLKAWSAAPPKMREPEVITDVEPALVSTAQSSQDGPEEVGDEFVRALSFTPSTEDDLAPSPGESSTTEESASTSPEPTSNHDWRSNGSEEVRY
ncbi:MAG: hypothetical protein ACJ72E_09595 [Marmoricola sp.]